MDYDKIVVAAAKTAVHHGCGDFEIEEFQSRRLEVQETQKQYLTVGWHTAIETCALHHKRSGSISAICSNKDYLYSTDTSSY